MTSDRSAFSRRRLAAIVSAVLILPGAVAGTAAAVNASHGDQVVSDNPANWTPHAMNGTVVAMVQVGNKMIAAGKFTSVSPSGTPLDSSDDLTRNRIFAFDASTGEIDRNFNPNLGGAANSLATDGSSIYVAGKFGNVGGDTRFKRIVKLTPAGQVDTSFRALPNKVVNEVVVHSGRVYIGGQFNVVKNGGTKFQRSQLAALDPSTGAVLPAVDLSFSGIYDPSVGGKTAIKRFDVSPDGNRMVVIGNFTQVGGQTRESVVMLNTSGATTTVAPWKTDRYALAKSNCANAFDSPMRDLDISPDGSFFVISTTGAFAGGAPKGTLCDTTSRWEMGSTGNDPSWIDYTGGDTTYGVAVTGGAVYVGGHFRYQNNPYQGDQPGPGSVPRSGVAALDTVNGLPLSWNPGRTRGVGAQAMYATDQGLWVGSDTIRFAKERRMRIAFLPLAGGTTIASVAPTSLPNTVFMAGGTSGGTGMQQRSLDSSGVPSGSASNVSNSVNWSSVRGSFYINGDLYYGTSSGELKRRTFNPSTGGAGPEIAVNLYNDPDQGTPTWSNLSSVTGMFYDTALHRLYYTVSGDSNLYYRYFTPESRIVGAQPFTASKPSGVSFSSAGGMVLAGGRILYGSSSDGALRSVNFSGGAVTSSSASTVSNDGSWKFRALFVPND